MKSLIAATVMTSLASIGLVGGSDTAKSSTRQETEIATPGGTTTITTEKEVKKVGEDPPATTR